MQTADMALKDLVARNQIGHEMAIAVSGNPNLFDDDTGTRNSPSRGR